MADVDKLIKDMEAYRQGYEQGRTEGIKSFQRVELSEDIDFQAYLRSLLFFYLSYSA